MRLSIFESVIKIMDNQQDSLTVKTRHPLTQHYCYQVRFDSAYLTALTLGKSEKPTSDDFNKLMYNIESRLIEGLFYDPLLQSDVKDVLFSFKMQTELYKLNEKRGERQRVPKEKTK